MSVSTDAAICVWRADPGICVARRQLPPDVGRPTALAVIQHPPGTHVDASGSHAATGESSFASPTLVAIAFSCRVAILDLQQLHLLCVVACPDQLGLLAVGGSIIPPAPPPAADGAAADDASRAAAAKALALSRPSAGSRSRAHLATLEIPGSVLVDLTGVENGGALWQWRGVVAPEPLSAEVLTPLPPPSREGRGGFSSSSAASAAAAANQPCPVLGWGSAGPGNDHPSRAAFFGASSKHDASKRPPPARRLQAAAVGPSGRSALLISAEGWVVLPVHPDREAPDGGAARASPSGGSSGTGRWSAGAFIHAGMIALTSAAGDSEGALRSRCFPIPSWPGGSQFVSFSSHP